MLSQCVVFDLDDTLYKEIEYVKSAFRYISDQLQGTTTHTQIYDTLWGAFSSGENPFDHLEERFHFNTHIRQYLDWYRKHMPDISLPTTSSLLLKHLKSEGAILGIITDGRSITQRNKIKALGLYDFFDNDNIIISEEFGSEKPSEANYLYFKNKYPHVTSFTYVADNPEKDFIAPKRLGWATIQLLDDGLNIHRQSNAISSDYQAHHQIESLPEILNLI
ncbi:MAG: HAD family hydrolase [Muribaculaceae bacterium]|nr:HAD family hydrolase [Muribaculaceae bacterium]